MFPSQTQPRTSSGGEDSALKIKIHSHRALHVLRDSPVRDRFYFVQLAENTGTDKLSLRQRKLSDLV